MDTAGWASVDAVRRLIGCRRGLIEEIVRDNDKQRLQLRGTRIRCCQGHSPDGVPVTLVGLEASWALFEGNEPIWHGTRVKALPEIAERGLLPMGRTHVHLAHSLDSVVGKRSGVAVMLRIDTAHMRDLGHDVFVSPNGVVLARMVPPAAIDRVRLLSRKAKSQADAIAAHFPIDP